MSAISFFSSSTVSDGAYVNSIVDQSAVITKLIGDSYFDSTSKLGTIFVYYTHEAGRQNKRFMHTYPDFTTSVSWSSIARDGTWQKTKVRVYDKEGAQHVTLPPDISSSENIVHYGGVMHLNT